LFARFSQARKADTDAIADLAVENFVEMRDKVADPEFLLWRAVEAEINKRSPGKYVSRYQLVTFTRVPYRLALRAGKLQAEILRELCAGKQRADQVDYARAGRLIDERLAPLLRGA
jgi:kynurenine 3-monooxygenase